MVLLVKMRSPQKPSNQLALEGPNLVHIEWITNNIQWHSYLICQLHVVEFWFWWIRTCEEPKRAVWFDPVIFGREAFLWRNNYSYSSPNPVVLCGIWKTLPTKSRRMSSLHGFLPGSPRRGLQAARGSDGRWKVYSAQTLPYSLTMSNISLICRCRKA